MSIRTDGLHHVTAIGGDPQRNADFYLRTLGLRMVKTTVNFDDPGTYHLYYGDESGKPGSLITFFPWRDVAPGRKGNGQATTTAFSVPEASIGWWKQHLAGAGVQTTEIREDDGEASLAFTDPDGLRIALVAHPQGDPRDPWDTPFVPAEHAIRGLYSVTLQAARGDDTIKTLTEDLGLTHVADHGNRSRFVAGDGGPGAFVDVLITPDAQPGLVAGGTVHHVAWRTPDDETQKAWREELVGKGHHVTSILDRQYFHSIYFREPGGTLLEIATDDLGFNVDEPLLELGRHLKLPPWLEPAREQIQHALPELNLPDENNPAVAERLADKS